MRFSITASFADTIELNVVPLDITDIVLWIPYLYYRKEIFYHHENKYHLFKDGKELIVIAHCKKKKNLLVNVGHVKRLVNSSKNFILLMIKPKADINHESFEGCDPKLKS